MAIIAFIIIISVIITVHELGHLYFAKKAGILCHEFSIGMGPVIYKKQFKETTFCIRAIPIGGYVSMAGEQNLDSIIKFNDVVGLNIENDKVTEIILDENKDAQVRGNVIEYDIEGKDENKLHISVRTETETVYYEIASDAFLVFEKGKKYQIEPYERSFDSKGKWARFITLFAGAMNNFILAIILYLIISFATGVPNYNSTEIGELTTSNQYVMPAEAAGIKVGDKIVAVNGKNVDSWTEFQEEINKLYKTKQADGSYKYNTTFVPLKINSNGEIKELTLETYTYVVSIGISNIGAAYDKDTLSYKTVFTIDGKEVKGLEVGEVEVRYKESPDKNYKIKKGDILTKIKVDYDDIINDKNVSLHYEKNLESWIDLINIFNEIKSNKNPAKVSFEYYQKNTSAEGNISYSYVTYDKSGIAEPYTDEVLSNQRIEKIQQKFGVGPVMHFDFWGNVGNAFKSFGDDFTLIFKTLKLLIAPSGVRQVGVQNLSSFVGIFSIVERYINSGFIALLGLTAMLSVNIGVVNLLPIPALDGGRIFFLLIEAVTKKKVPKKVENIINNVFFILLLGLFLFVTVNDIIRLF